MCTVTEIISLWNWDLLSKHTTGYISSIALIAPFFGSISSSLSIFYYGFELMFFSPSLSTWPLEAWSRLFMLSASATTNYSSSRDQSSPDTCHLPLSVLEPNILSLSTDSLLLLLYDIGRSLLLRFFPSFSSVGVFNLSLFQPYALQ